MSYYKYKEPDVPEIQMGMLISAVRNALGGKTSPKEFMISHQKESTKGLQPMSSEAVKAAFGGITKKMK